MYFFVATSPQEPIQKELLLEIRRLRERVKTLEGSSIGNGNGNGTRKGKVVVPRKSPNSRPPKRSETDCEEDLEDVIVTSGSCSLNNEVLDQDDLEDENNDEMDDEEDGEEERNRESFI